MSPRLGTVDEDFVFQIAGAPDHIVVNVRGEVVGPTFHADVAELDYGVVPFGFVTSRYVTVRVHDTGPRFASQQGCRFICLWPAAKDPPR